jgi:lipocalin
MGRWYEIESSLAFRNQHERNLSTSTCPCHTRPPASLTRPLAVCTQADYTLQSDGMVRVNNSGLQLPTLQPTSAIGKAKQVCVCHGLSTRLQFGFSRAYARVQVSGGKLAVSFFANFYGPYWVRVKSVLPGSQSCVSLTCM